MHFSEGVHEPVALIPELSGLEISALAGGFRAYTPEPGPLAQSIVSRATALKLHIDSIATQAPTLEDVFLTLTAKR